MTITAFPPAIRAVCGATAVSRNDFLCPCINVFFLAPPAQHDTAVGAFLFISWVRATSCSCAVAGLTPDQLSKLVANPEIMVLMQNSKMQEVMKKVSQAVQIVCG